jgi:hypothetical protein
LISLPFHQLSANCILDNGVQLEGSSRRLDYGNASSI